MPAERGAANLTNATGQKQSFTIIWDNSFIHTCDMSCQLFFQAGGSQKCLSEQKQTGMDLPGEIGVKKTSLRPTSLKKKLTRHMGALSIEAKRETFKTD